MDDRETREQQMTNKELSSSLSDVSRPQEKEDNDHGAGLAAVGHDTTVVQTPQLSHDELAKADQAIWDAAWALHDPDPNGQQWRRSKALKDAIDILIAAVRAEQESTQ